MTDAKEAYKKWVFEGNCPCCFPDWEYGDEAYYMIGTWMDEFQAWAVYDEIQGEYDDED